MLLGYSRVNSSEINGSTRLPATPVLSIISSVDGINILNWDDTDIWTDFFVIYWSPSPFSGSSVDNYDNILPIYNVSSGYAHEIPVSNRYDIIYYRVAALNELGSIFSNQVDNYSYKIVVYKDTYAKVLDEILDRFTPEIRKQYKESILWKSFVEALAGEITAAKLTIKDAVAQLNFQKANDVFLELWSNIIGIKRGYTSLGILESDDEYKLRLINSIFWDKVSNFAIRRTILSNLGYDSSVANIGFQASYSSAQGIAMKGYLQDYGMSILNINTKKLSNIYDVSISGTTLTDLELNELYSQVEILSALGNVLMSVSQNLTSNYEDTVTYGPIFMGWQTRVPDLKDTEGAGAQSWGFQETIYFDNQRQMNQGLLFNNNNNPDDIASLTWIA